MMKHNMNKETVYHRIWLLALLAGGYSTIAVSTGHTVPMYRAQQHPKCLCRFGYPATVVAITGNGSREERPGNDPCGLIIKQPIGDVERRVNHLGEYHD